MMKYCDGHERWVQMTMKHVWILSVLQCNYRLLPEAEPVAAAYKRLINREFLYLNSVSLKDYTTFGNISSKTPYPK